MLSHQTLSPSLGLVKGRLRQTSIQVIPRTGIRTYTIDKGSEEGGIGNAIVMLWEVIGVTTRGRVTREDFLLMARYAVWLSSL